MQLAAHRYFGSAAWLLAGPAGGAVPGEIQRSHRFTPEGDLVFHYRGRCAQGALEWSVKNNAVYYDWMWEHPVKDLPRDFPAFERLFLPPPETLELQPIRDAVAGVGGDGIVTAYVGSLFFSFIASHLEGGSAQAILSLLDDEPFFAGFQERYLARLRRVAERIVAETDAQILLLENGYSTAGIISPAMFARWDVPVIRAVAEVTRRAGRLLHLHQHGKCRALLDLIAACDVDLVEPFERPPSGDTPDLGEIKRRYGRRLAIRGNMHSHATLLRGSPEDVEREARECLEAAAPGGGFILASGDGVIAGTPFENIFRMVAAGEKYGRGG
jgi:uroporphyrinogen decarboxylase